MTILSDDICTFSVAGLAHTKGSWISVGKGKMRPDNPAAGAWESTIGWRAKLAMGRAPAVEGRVLVSLVFTLPRPPNKSKKHRRDIDKLARAALDAMSKIVYLDDEQVDDLHVRKLVSDRASDYGVTIRVSRILEEHDDG